MARNTVAAVPAVEFSDADAATIAQPPAPVGPTAKQLRAFGLDHGFEVKARGKIPAAVVAAFGKAPKKVTKKYLV